MTDKELGIKARRRLQILEKNGITNDSIEYYKTMVENFYEQNHVPKTSKSGFSINKKMNVKQRAEMRKILRSFMKDEETSLSGIRKTYEEKFKYYSEKTKKIEIIPATTVKEMASSLKYLDRTLSDRAIRRYLDSKQIQPLVNHSKDTGKSFNEYRNALLSIIKESIDDNQMSKGYDSDISFDDILLDDVPDNAIYQQYSDDELIDEVINRVMR